MKDICADHGFEGVFPLDGEVGMQGLAAEEMAETIFAANIGPNLFHQNRTVS